jgi:putative flippase GtrA
VSKYSYLSKKFKNVGIIKRFPIIIQFIKFCLVGLTNLGVDYVIYWLLTRIFGWYFIWARLISFVVAVSWSFTVNRRWTFKSDGRNMSAKYIKFVVTSVIGMILNLSLFYIFVDRLAINDLLALFITAVLISIFKFLVNYFWAFGDKSVSDGASEFI